MIPSIEELRAELGPQLKQLEDSAYQRGYDDRANGRARAVSQSTAASGTRRETAANVDPTTMARRADRYVGEMKNLGIVVSSADAVKHVYEEAGVPLG